MKASKAPTVDAFIAESTPEARPLIEKLRKVIMSAVPGAEETMSYGKPYYKYHGYMTGITVYTKYLAVEIFDGLSDDDREKLEAAGHKCGSKNFNIAFDQKIPVDLLRQLVQEQAKRNEA